MWCIKCRDHCGLEFVDDVYVSDCCWASIIGDIDFTGPEALEAEARAEEAEAEAKAWVKARTEGAAKPGWIKRIGNAIGFVLLLALLLWFVGYGTYLAYSQPHLTEREVLYILIGLDD